jgi:chemotaxis protein MotB
MVGLLLIFVFVVTLFTITSTILSRSIWEKNSALEQLRDQLTSRMKDIEDLSAQISKLQQLFQGETEKSVSLQQTIDTLSKELESGAAQLKEREIALADKDAQVVAKTKELEDTEKLVSAQKSEVESALSNFSEATGLLGQREKQIQELGAQLQESQTELAKSKSDFESESKTALDLKSKLDSVANQVSALNARIASYVEEIGRLNKLLAESQTSESGEKTKAAALQKEISSLRSKLDELSSKLAQKQQDTAQQFKLSQLVELLGQKEQEIDQLKKLARYRSEFLSKLEEIFAGVSDIRVHGDRFVFQSEILFASGRTEINERGKTELDKFAKIYREMEPKIPSGLDMIILVQGHTDIDPVKSAKYHSNWELSAARAMQVVRYLMDKGIPPERIGASALGEFHPVEKDTSAQSKRLNRRIEIKITTL